MSAIMRRCIKIGEKKLKAIFQCDNEYFFVNRICGDARLISSATLDPDVSINVQENTYKQ
jgi:hypothetical protein